MSQLDKLAQFIIRRPNCAFDDLHWSILVVLGGLSFIGAGYWGLAISTVVLDLIKATNKAGLPPLAIGLWLLIGFYAIAVWYFGCIASRCHGVLYERWFK
jgi:hypothetical protein